MIWTLDAFQKLTQFSHGSNALDANTSNTDAFLLRDPCVSSTQLKAYLEQHEPDSIMKTLICRK